MRDHPGTFVFGLVFAIFGSGYLLDLAGIWNVRPIRLWPITLIAIGAVIVLTARNSDRDG